MAKITREYLGFRKIKKWPDCDMCIRRAYVYWESGDVIFLCSNCCVTILPRLMADTISTRNNNRIKSDVLLLIEKVTKAIWFGIATNMMIKKK